MPTPLPAQRLPLAQAYLHQENFAAAAEQFQEALQSAELNEAERQQALLGLAESRLRLEEPSSALEALGRLLAAAQSTIAPGPAARAPGATESLVPLAYFRLGQAHQAAGDCQAAVGAYETYLRSHPEVAAYVLQLVAECHNSLGNLEAAALALAQAAEAPALPSTTVSSRLAAAASQLALGDTAGALSHYEAILEVSEDESALALANLLAGQATLAAGGAEAAYDYFLRAVSDYPKAPSSYAALVALVEAGVPVDEFQRGLVNFQARSYDSALAAFNRYVAAHDVHREDAHLYLAWSAEALGNFDGALEQMDVYLGATEPSEEAPTAARTMVDYRRGWLERARLLAGAGRHVEAIADYQTFLSLEPTDSEAADAGWALANLYAEAGDVEAAVEAYRRLAETYPEDLRAAEALYQAGRLHWQAGNEESALAAWQTALDGYLRSDYGSASLLALMTNAPEAEASAYQEQALTGPWENYYGVRAWQLAREEPPFLAADTVDLAMTHSGREAAEAWLLEQFEFEVPAGDDLSDLGQLATDGRLIRGSELWRLGLRPEAKAELESLRLSLREDPLASYRLAVYFSELGLYRSSILAVASVLRLAGSDVFSAPDYLGRLAYPIYYADLVTAEAERYGYDPLLQFALIRQESLFESFATSSAAAQGLSQVIPDTGAYIAGRLNWPDFENEDLYLPYVGVAFGAYYLNQQLEAFGGNVAGALSAYNGGPGNAARWLAEAPDDDLDAYLAVVDFWETREYVRRIFVGQAAYRFLYGSD